VPAGDHVHFALVRELSDARANLIRRLAPKLEIRTGAANEVGDQQPLTRELRRGLAALCERRPTRQAEGNPGYQCADVGACTQSRHSHPPRTVRCFANPRMSCGAPLHASLLAPGSFSYTI